MEKPFAALFQMYQEQLMGLREDENEWVERRDAKGLMQRELRDIETGMLQLSITTTADNTLVNINYPKLWLN